MNTSSSLGETFNYTIPNGPIICGYLRVHIVGVYNSNQLDQLQPGLSIVEIFGQPPANYISPLTSIRKREEISTYYNSITIKKSKSKSKIHQVNF